MPEIPYSVYAQRLATIGLLPIPTRSNKESLIKWRDVNRSSLTQSYFEQFDLPKVGGIAIVAGAISGNLECIDVDCKYDLSGDLYDNIVNNIIEWNPDVYKKLTFVRTPSGGYHILYRVDGLAGPCRKLARRLQTQDEFARDVQNARDKNIIVPNKPSQRVLIETKGEGGYFLGWPSPGYEFLPDNNWTKLSKITQGERDTLIEICCSLDQLPRKDVVEKREVQQLIVPVDQLYKPTYSVPRQVSKTKYLVTPWEDFNSRNSAFDLLTQRGWLLIRSVPDPNSGRMVNYLRRPGETDKDVSATFNHVPNKAFVFTTSTNLPHLQPLEPFDVLLHSDFGGSFKLAYDYLVTNGYGVLLPTPDRPEMPQSVLEPVKLKPGINTDYVVADAVRGQVVETWWRTDIEFNDDGEIKKKKTTILQHKFCEWLGEKGLRCRKQVNDYQFVLLDGIIIAEVNKKQISDMVMAYIKTLPARFDYIDRETLLELFVKGVDTYLADLKLSMTPAFDEDMIMRDSRTEAYIPFLNGVLVLRKGSAEELTPYRKFNKFIWKTSIRQYNYQPSEADALTIHPFSKFLYNVANREENRYFNLRQLIGYCLSTYKDPSLTASVIFCDSKVSAADRSEGGSGKGLIVKAMGYVRNTVYEDGKQANKRNQGEFRFSRVMPDTEILHIADLEKDFDFEAMFSLLTEGMPIRKLYTQEVYIPYAKAPKVIFSTNYMVAGSGGSHDRRKIEFEFSDYYNARHTPFMEFKHQFFDDWSEEQWIQFYGIMAGCLNDFLNKGEPKFGSINLEVRKFQTETEGAFVSWFTRKFGSPEEVRLHGPRVTGGVMDFNNLYLEYLSFAGLERNETRPIRFMKYMHAGCAYIGVELKEGVETTKSAYGGGETMRRTLEIVDLHHASRVQQMEVLANRTANNVVKQLLHDTKVEIQFPTDNEGK